MKKENKKIAILTIFLGIIDQISKIWIILINKEIPIFQTGIVLRIVEKENIDVTNNITHILIAIIAVIVMVRYITSNNQFIRKESKIILSFGIAGIISNSIDRVIRGNVVTFIDFGKNITLNLSYIYLIIAWVGFIIILLKNSTKGVGEKWKS